MITEGMLRRVTPETLSRLLGEELELEPFVQREIPRELLERKLRARPDLPAEIRAHYERLLAGPPDGVKLEPALDLHKAWHGIHFLLTGQAAGGTPPLAYAVLGFPEQPIGDDLGDGPATYLEPARVRDVAAALAELSPDELRRRFDPAQMTALEIEPTAIWKRAGEDDFEWLMQFYAPLPDYYAEAAQRGDAMLIWRS